MREEFGLVGGDVHVHRAVALAALAGEAEVERFLDGLVTPSAGHHFPLQHFEEQVGAAPGGVHFLARGHVAGAHGPALGAAALADADAAHGGARELPLVVGEAEARFRLRRVEAGPDAQVLVQAVGMDDLAGIHAVQRVPQRLELLEGAHQLRAKHFGQQLGARLPVAVLAGERSAVGEHQVGGTFDETAVALHPVLAFQVEVGARVHAAVAEVAVKSAAVPVAFQQVPELPQVAAQLLGRHRGVLPAFPHHRHAGDERGGTQGRLAHLPHLLFLGDVLEEVHGGRTGLPAERLHQPAGLVLGFALGVTAELHQQPAAACRKQVDAVRVQALPAHIADERVVEALQADAAVGEDLHDVVGGLVRAGVPQDQQGARGRAGDQLEGGLQHHDAGALGAHQGARHLEAVLRKEFIEVVAGDAARDAGEARADEIGIAVAEVAQPAIDLAPAPAGADDGIEFRVAGRADGHARAVVGDDLHLLHVRRRASRHDGVHAAGVVADHPAEGAAVVGGGVGAEREAMAFGGAPQVVEDDARLHHGAAPLRVEGYHAVHVPGEVEDHRHVAALSRQAGAAAAAEHGGGMLAAESERGDGVLFVAREDDADRHLAVVGAVSGVEGAAAGVEAHLAAQAAPQVARQGGGVEVAG